MNNYGNASEGLQKMFIAQVCLYHMQRAVCHSDHQSAIVLSIIYLVGLYNAGKDINGCANAFVLSIISLVCNIISSLTSFNVLFAMLFSVAAAVLTFMVTYQVCTSCGRKPWTQRYRKPWKKHMDCIFDRFYIKCSCCYSGCSDPICGCYHSGNECCLYNGADPLYSFSMRHS